jgi:predicted transcriptional regulator
MRVQAEVLAKVLRERGLNDSEIAEILAVAQVTAKTSQSRRSRAKLVRSEKLDEATMEQFRQQLLLREWERRVRRQLKIFSADSVQISSTQSVVVFRQGDTVIEVTLRHSSGRSAPYNRRFIAQKLPMVKTQRIELVRMVVSTAEKTEVLTVVGRQRGVVLPKSERKWLMTALDETVTVRCGKWQAKLPKLEWQQIVKSWRCKYPVIERRWSELEVSADGERWFRVSQLIGDRTH